MTTLAAEWTRCREGRVEVGRGIGDQCHSLGERCVVMARLVAVEQRWLRKKHRARAW